jgi:hypothetical protein
MSGSQQIGVAAGHAAPSGQQVLPLGPQNLPEVANELQQRFEQHFLAPEQDAKDFLHRSFFFLRFFFASTSESLRRNDGRPVAPSTRR